MTNTTIPAYVTAPEDAGTQEPIWDQEAEQSVLGGILLDNRAFDSAAEFLREGASGTPRTRRSGRRWRR